MTAAAATIRAPQADDLAAVVSLLIACDVAEYGVPDTTDEDVAADWRLSGFSLKTDAWVAADRQGGLLAYAYAGDQFRTGVIESDVFVHPHADWNELGGALLDRVEQRAAELVRDRGYRSDPRLELFAAQVNDPKRALLETRGFTIRRRVYRMDTDLSAGVARLYAAPGTAVLVFRPGTDERAMYDTMFAAFDDHFRDSNEPFDAWRQRLIGHGDFDPGFWFLAWEAERAVGALIAYDHGDLGWVKGLGVLPPWRRRGIGGALLTTVLAAFASRGQMRVGLGVDSESTTGASRLYERAGMRVTQVHDLYGKALPVG